MNNDSRKKWIISLVAVAYCSFLYFNFLQLIPQKAVDFPTFYYPPKLAFSGHTSPYDYAAMNKAGAEIGQQVHPYLYPPPGLILFYPFTLFDYQAAKLLMLILNHALIVILLYILLFRIVKTDLISPFFLLAVIYSLSFYSFLDNLQMGQANIIIAALICMGWAALIDRKHPGIVALFFAAASLVKLNPLIFIAYFFAARQFKVLLWYGIYLSGMFLLSVVIMPSSSWLDWSLHVAPTIGYSKDMFGMFSPATPWNASVNGFTSRLFLENYLIKPLFPGKALALVSPYLINGIIVLVSCAVVFAAAKKDPDRTALFGMPLFLLAMHMTLPFAGELQLICVLPALIIFAGQVLLSKKISTVIISSAALLMLSAPFPFLSPLLKNGVMTLFISTKLFILFGIWCYFIMLLGRNGLKQVKSA